MEITIGSTFDGIAGFPLAGQRNGMKALWASEIETFPIKVTKIRFPEMKHYGDITKINGAEVEPVDIITGGSPCQDLSVAGKRAGMKHKDKGDEETTRSGLFMEQVRIVKEMRENDQRNGRTGKSIRPRFMVWENVPGAFSSNKGEDFRAVLEEICRVKDSTLSVPRPPKDKWNRAGCIMGDGFSIAWRILDAQFWGVPQRRRRIFLVADFGGQSAPEILFKREGLLRNTAESGEAWEGTSPSTERGFNESGKGYWGEGLGSIRTNGSRPTNVVSKSIGFSGKNSATMNLCPSEELSPTLRSRAETHVMTTYGLDSYNQAASFEVINPLRSASGGDTKPMIVTTVIPINDQATHQNGYSNGSMVGNPGDPMYSLTAQDKHCIAFTQNQRDEVRDLQDKAGALAAEPGIHQQTYVAKINCEPSGIAGAVSSKWAKGTGGPAGDEHYNLVCTVDCRNMCENTEKSGTLQSKPNGGQSLNYQNPVRIGYSVRRLTPLECDRLQDYPDDWTLIPGASDSARYKADGNSVAVCCPDYVLEGIKLEILKAE